MTASRNMVLSSNTEDCHQMGLMNAVGWHLARHPELKLLHHIPNGGLRNKAVAGKLKAMGQRAGVPDLMLPVARGGFHGLYIEMKRPAGADGSRAGVTSKEQREWIADLRCQDYCVRVAFGWEEGLKALLEYLALAPTKVAE